MDELLWDHDIDGLVAVPNFGVGVGGMPQVLSRGFWIMLSGLLVWRLRKRKVAVKLVDFINISSISDWVLDMIMLNNAHAKSCKHIRLYTPKSTPRCSWSPVCSLLKLTPLPVAFDFARAPRLATRKGEQPGGRIQFTPWMLLGRSQRQHVTAVLTNSRLELPHKWMKYFCTEKLMACSTSVVDACGLLVVQ